MESLNGGDRRVVSEFGRVAKTYVGMDEAPLRQDVDEEAGLSPD